MAFKINVAHNGKTFKAETENEALVGLAIGRPLEGKDISEDLEGYELEITGTSDKAGFPGLVEYAGPGLRKVLLGYGKGMKQRPRKEGKKKVSSPKGLRLRKTVRGGEISMNTVQINTKVLKEGKKKFDDLFKAPETEGSESAGEEEKKE